MTSSFSAILDRGIRELRLLSIADCFRPVPVALAKLANRGLLWADCEALACRHNFGRGTLVVLDVAPESGMSSNERRRAMLESLIQTPQTNQLLCQ